ncbi:MAG: hypothetical protein IAB80_09680 [Bacteroidetes bacterium]|uniref:Uncharacterized protein n=1 Tax=Candidatus Cryptobacteroides excrementipullorum TaxID=2840761 RepID=A0A9D9IU86_9BACT|nr:hypothetical protein [Candidatus Cryptobacteroides excrementipullorum]
MYEARQNRKKVSRRIDYTRIHTIQKSRMPPKSFSDLLREAKSEPRISTDDTFYRFVAGVDFQRNHLHGGNINDFFIEEQGLVEGSVISDNGNLYDFSVIMYCYRDRIEYAGGVGAANLAPIKKCLVMGKKETDGRYRITHLEREVN